MDGDEPTQATQNVLDPRRVGKQNYGFSDEDISDIVCVLYPHSEPARQELHRLAQENSPFIIGKDEANGVEADYTHEDEAGRFQPQPMDTGNYALMLRLSANLKDPSAGFAFGRNVSRCDVVFVNDPKKRISNVHFRIYINEYGAVMIEDQSTNGTWVDGQLLSAHPNRDRPQDNPISRWLLSSGAVIRIWLHHQARDLTFRVRIPRRDDEYAQAYGNKVDAFFARHGIMHTTETITRGPTGHVVLFGDPPNVPVPPLPVTAAAHDETTRYNMRSPVTVRRRDPPKSLVRPWTGSGKYNVTGHIGKGAFAVVHKVTSKYDGKPYAAKELEKRKFMKNGVVDQKVENEMKIMRRVSHPNIVRYIENFEWDDRLLIIIMEFVSGGDLGKFITEQGVLDEMETRQVSAQLLGALGYLHANNITHRDVKPDNILIDSIDPIQVKLTDFGLSKMVDSEQTFLRTFCGTLLYCAPEVYTEYSEYDENGVRSRGKKVRRMPGQRYNHAVDIWSLGGVLFYTLTFAAPYPVKNGISPSELLHKIMTTPLNVVPLQNKGVSDLAINFLRCMLERRPEQRATVADLESHMWMANPDSTIAASQSYDEITDDEDMIDDPFSQYQNQFEEDRVSDSMDDESEKENETFRPGQPVRLFGEVGVSAIGSSGVIPEDFLNISGGNPSGAETEILGADIDEAYISEDSATRNPRTRRVYRQTTASIAKNQSEDQLQSLVEEVASQSLGGKDSVVHLLGPSTYSMQSNDFNSSKRKPPPTDTSDEFEENTPTGKPTMKRLKSEGNMEALADDLVEEYKLLAKMPQVTRLWSGRQIDNPVPKMNYWEKDTKTWHLAYPEMTQLQHDAFSQAARDRGEEFGPGKSPLWDLAMKYFPPTLRAATIQNGSTLGLTEQDIFPSTAPPIDSDIPDTLPPETGIVVPVSESAMSKRAVAMVESHENSEIKGISFSVTDSLVSFGRGPENTEVFQPRTESRVPKYAMKIMLWKDGDTYDPSKDPNKVPHPWLRDTAEDPDLYHFYISTKATWGIQINGYTLASSDPKNPNGPSRHWTRLYNGDELLVWGNPGTPNQTTLVFKCFWGGSSQARGANKTLETLPQISAQKLDAACIRTEKRIKDAADGRKKFAEAKADGQMRQANVAQERERSEHFEAKRQEAINYLVKQGSGSRRSSPASAPPTSRLQAAQLPRHSPDSEHAVPAR